MRISNLAKLEWQSFRNERYVGSDQINEILSRKEVRVEERARLSKSTLKTLFEWTRDTDGKANFVSF